MTITWLQKASALTANHQTYLWSLWFSYLLLGFIARKAQVELITSTLALLDFGVSVRYFNEQPCSIQGPGTETECSQKLNGTGMNWGRFLLKQHKDCTNFHWDYVTYLETNVWVNIVIWQMLRSQNNQCTLWFTLFILKKSVISKFD